MNKTKDSTLRFSSRVDNYVKFRPGYPDEVISYLKEKAILKGSSVIADIGSGTGISSEIFLKSGNTVYGIEPNKEMRLAAERLLKVYKSFHSVNGTAEATTLQDKSIDLITAGQAFHWFNIDRSKEEFRRILKAGGHVVLIWNSRKNNSSGFMFRLEELLLKWATDYREVNHKNIDANIISSFYKPEEFSTRSFDNFQLFDLEGLKGRILSASYAPLEGHVNYEPMMHGLEELFGKFQENGKVRFEYDTEVYSGKI